MSVLPEALDLRAHLTVNDPVVVPDLAFPKFGKMPRWWKSFTISEKIDGTNGLIQVWEEDELPPGAPILAQDIRTRRYVAAGSRNRWLGLGSDNHGFARWVWDNAEHVVELGSGVHYGEWYGSGINRSYGLTNGEKHFALFNTHRWGETRPEGFEVVPTLWVGSGDELHYGINGAIQLLALDGSQLRPGFMRPEGIVIYSHENKAYWKKYLENDRSVKG